MDIDSAVMSSRNMMMEMSSSITKIDEDDVGIGCHWDNTGSAVV
jgi:hypothetical protein